MRAVHEPRVTHHVLDGMIPLLFAAAVCARPIAPGDTLAPTLAADSIAVVTTAERPDLGPRRLASRFAIAGASTDAPFAADTTRPRRKAVEYSDWYAKRLAIHRVASYTMLPLFGIEYALGQKLLDNSTPSTRNQHSLAAGAVATLFGVNTITGVWNWWDARNDPNGRTRRTVHTLLMLAADAGFAATGALASSASNSHDKALTHRNVALGSMGIATLGTALMWFWKD